MTDHKKKFFDQIAPHWDLSFTAEDFERLPRVLDTLPIRPGMSILDLGCGTGIMFDYLRRKVGNSGSVVGIDLSSKMALKARQNFPFENIDILAAEAGHLPFAESVFDMAIAFSAFPHFTDQQKAISEAHRVLRKGAPLYIIHLLSSRELAEVHHRAGGAVEHDCLPSKEDLHRMLSAGGFTDISIDDQPSLYLASAVNGV